MRGHIKGTVRHFLICFLFVACSKDNFTQSSELETEHAVAEQQRQVVENLKRQINSEQQRSSEQIPAQIEGQESQVNNLTSLISELHQDQAALSEELSEATNRERIEAGASKDQIETLIQSLQQNIPHTEEQITLLLGYSYRTNEQEARLQDLKTEAAAQKQQLGYLQTQLATLNAESLNRINSLFSQAQDQKRDLASYRDEMQSELAARQETLSALKSQTFQSRMSLMMLNQQLQSAEKNYESQQEKVKSIEAQSGTVIR